MAATSAARTLEDPTGELALVTGATSGIGHAYATALAHRGYRLVVTGRRTERLRQFAAEHEDVRPLTADLATFEGIAAVEEVCAREEVDLLVNNAGVAHYMPLADLPADKARELTFVKVVAPTLLTRAVVGGMLARGTGAIVDVAGMIAFSGPAPSTVGPRRTVYAGVLAHAVAMSRCR